MCRSVKYHHSSAGFFVLLKESQFPKFVQRSLRFWTDQSVHWKCFLSLIDKGNFYWTEFPQKSSTPHFKNMDTVYTLSHLTEYFNWKACRTSRIHGIPRSKQRGLNRQENVKLSVIPLVLIKKSLLDSWLAVCESYSQACKCILLPPRLHQFREQSTLTFHEFYTYLSSYYWWYLNEEVTILITPCYRLVSNNIITIFPCSYEKHNVQGANHGCSQALGTFKLYFRSSTQGA